MDIFSNILMGFGVALSAQNLLFCLIGTIYGTLIGVLPGIGPVVGVAILIPITFGLNATTAIITMAGVYYGAMYGGSTTSILINVPGESASVVTCLDGYEMAKKGRAAPALGMAALASFIAGTLAVILLTFIAPAPGQCGPLLRTAGVFRSGLHGPYAGDQLGRRVHGEGIDERHLRPGRRLRGGGCRQR